MKFGRRKLIVFFIVCVAFIQCIDGLQVTVSGGGSSDRGSVTMRIDAAKETTVNGGATISGADIQPVINMKGKVKNFEQTHSVTDKSGKTAQVYVKVVNAPNGVDYKSLVLPKEGKVLTQPEVSAEQWLTVPRADSITCTASASHGIIQSADVGISEIKGLSPGDYVTLSEYYSKASATATQVSAVQTATRGSGKLVVIFGDARDSSGIYTAITPLSGSFNRLSASSSSGTSTQVSQTEHIIGSFVSAASAGTKIKTRTSNYGTEYDLNVNAAKGKSPTGILGYYVNSITSANKIQGAVNAAQSGDSINIAPGTYKENVQIDKSLIVKGTEAGNTIVDGNLAGSVFTIGKINPNVDVTLSDMTIQSGSGTLTDFGDGNIQVCGGGIWNAGTTNLKNCNIGTTANPNTALYGGGIYNVGTLTVKGSTISSNSAAYSDTSPYTPAGGGIYNDLKGALTVESSRIFSNDAGYGGGVYNLGTATMKDSEIDSNVVNSYDGGGIENWGGNLIVDGCNIHGNTAYDYGGGIENWGGMLAVTNSNIYENTAIGGGAGGISNSAIMTLTGSEVYKNIANWEGGGIVNYDDGVNLIRADLKDSSIYENTAWAWGGGIFNNGVSGTAVVNIDNCQIFGNRVESTGSFVGFGGGIYNLGTTMNLNSGSITKNSARLGGGIYNEPDGIVNLNGGSIDQNTATDPTPSGGGIYNLGTIGGTGDPSVIVQGNAPDQIAP